MPIVQTDVPMTSRLASRAVSLLALRYDACRADLLTFSGFGRPVRMLWIGRGQRRLLFSAAHHANEWLTATVLLKFAEDYARAIAEDSEIFGQNARELYNSTTLGLIPMMDPDGVDLVTGAIVPGSPQYNLARQIADGFPQIPFPSGWKADLQGVDLNLQYPAGWLQAREIKFSQGFTGPAPRDYVGSYPLSQREPRALAELTRDFDPDLVLAYHSQGKLIFYQFQDIEVPGAQELADRFAQVSGYTVAEVPYNSSFAGYKDWFIQEFRRPGFTIEVGQGVNPLPIEQFDEIYRDNLGILVTALTG